MPVCKCACVDTIGSMQIWILFFFSFVHIISTLFLLCLSWYRFRSVFFSSFLFFIVMVDVVVVFFVFLMVEPLRVRCHRMWPHKIQKHEHLI